MWGETVAIGETLALRPQESLRVLPRHQFKGFLGIVRELLIVRDLVRGSGLVIQMQRKCGVANVTTRISVQVPGSELRPVGAFLRKSVEISGDDGILHRILRAGLPLVCQRNLHIAVHKSRVPDLPPGKPGRTTSRKGWDWKPKSRTDCAGRVSVSPPGRKAVHRGHCYCETHKRTHENPGEASGAKPTPHRAADNRTARRNSSDPNETPENIGGRPRRGKAHSEWRWYRGG